MESNGAGTLAHQSLLLHDTLFASDRMTSNQHLAIPDDSFPLTDVLDTTMTHAPGTLHDFPASSIRKTVADMQEEETARATLRIDDVALAANILASGPAISRAMEAEDCYPHLVDSFAQSDLYGAAVPENALIDDPANESDSVIRANMRAYAKLVLPDGDFFITTSKLKVIRDMDCFREYQHELKLAKRAQRELDRYAQEPSMPSQPGDGDQNGNPSSKSSQSLVGRPARGLPSNYSEQGGAVAYTALSDGEAGHRRKRKRKVLSGKVSSAGSGSIAPASLHPNLNGIYGCEDDAHEDIQVLPVHPSIPADIVKISKEHLLFAYNNAEERWELEVLGARCMVNDGQHVRGDVVPLRHDDEIMVVSLTIRFKLPDQRGHSPGISHGTFGESDLDMGDDDDDSLSDTSSAARALAVSVEIEDLNNEEETEADLEDVVAESSIGKSQPKIKLSLKTKASAAKASQIEQSRLKEKAVKLNLKQQKKKDDRPAEPVKKPEKGKKPKKEPTDPSIDEGLASCAVDVTQSRNLETTGEQNGEKPISTQISPPALPPVIEPGSIFEGVAPEEMPQKRKGPGRPPKNGLISKRDQSFVKRKIKEYEKRGEQPPPMDELVSIVRAENKAKEAAQKAAARGDPVPEVVPSIEYDGHTPMVRQEHETHPHQQHQLSGHPNGDDLSVAPFDPNRGPSSPRLKHIARSPSPIKPETEFTEEEMKKPTMTYVHILDEVLKDHPIGKADLQEIYDRICKRYPYFKYKTTTSGWQSSVRHNLLQHGRFRESGRSGKGRLWTIDYSYDLSKEKKRKLTPPPRPQPTMQNGNYSTGMQAQTPQYGQANYQTPYGHPGPNAQSVANGLPLPPGQTPYYSPYGPSQPGHVGHYGASHGQHSSVPSRGPLGPPPAQAPQLPPNQQPPGASTSQSPAPSQTAPPPATFQVVVDGIMRYRERYLAPYSQDTAAFKFHEDLFKKCTAFVSDIFHGQAASVDTGSFTEEEQRVFNELSGVVNRCKAGGSTPAAETSASSTNKDLPTTQHADIETTQKGSTPSPGTPLQTASPASIPVQPTLTPFGPGHGSSQTVPTVPGSAPPAECEPSQAGQPQLTSAPALPRLGANVQSSSVVPQIQAAPTASEPLTTKQLIVSSNAAGAPPSQALAVAPPRDPPTYGTPALVPDRAIAEVLAEGHRPDPQGSTYIPASSAQEVGTGSHVARPLSAHISTSAETTFTAAAKPTAILPLSVSTKRAAEDVPGGDKEEIKRLKVM